MTEDHDEDTYLEQEADKHERAQTPVVSAKDNNQRQLEMRRRLEDRLERRRLRDELGLDDLWELDF